MRENFAKKNRALKRRGILSEDNKKIVIVLRV